MNYRHLPLKVQALIMVVHYHAMARRVKFFHKNAMRSLKVRYKIEHYGLHKRYLPMIVKPLLKIIEIYEMTTEEHYRSILLGFWQQNVIEHR